MLQTFLCLACKVDAACHFLGPHFESYAKDLIVSELDKLLTMSLTISMLLKTGCIADPCATLCKLCRRQCCETRHTLYVTHFLSMMLDTGCMADPCATL